MNFRKRELQPVLLRCSAAREAAIMRSPCTAAKSGPRAPQLEKARAAAKIRHHQKMPPPARGAGTLIPSAQRFVWA